MIMGEAIDIVEKTTEKTVEELEEEMAGKVIIYNKDFLFGKNPYSSYIKFIKPEGKVSFIDWCNNNNIIISCEAYNELKLYKWYRLYKSDVCNYGFCIKSRDIEWEINNITHVYQDLMYTNMHNRNLFINRKDGLF